MVPCPLPYLGLVAELDTDDDGNRINFGQDTEFLAPDRTLAYLRTLAPPGIWEVADDYPCELSFQGAGLRFWLSGDSCRDGDGLHIPGCYDPLTTTVAEGGWFTGINPAPADGTVLLDEYRCPALVGVEAIAAGTWTARLFVDADDVAFIHLRYQVSVQHADLTETLIEDHSTATLDTYPIVHSVVSQVDFTFTHAAIPIVAGDTIVVRVYAVIVSAPDAPFVFLTYGDAATFPTSFDASSFLSTPATTLSRVFSTPAADAAPWTLVGGVSVIDGSPAFAPEAADLLGYLITDIDGLMEATITRQASRTTYDLGGGHLEREHPGPREVKITGLIVGATPMAVEWGERWLHAQLDPGCGTCDKQAFSFRKCCPSESDPELGYWIAYDGGLLNGPTVTPIETINGEPGEEIPHQSCYLAEFEFTIGFEDPFLYKPIKYLASGWDTYSFLGGQQIGITGAIVDFRGNNGIFSIYTDLPVTGECGTPVQQFSFVDDFNILWDGSRKRILPNDFPGEPFDRIDTGGLPLSFPQVDSECFRGFCITLDGTGDPPDVYTQYKEYG